jgi:hypothetical protein
LTNHPDDLAAVQCGVINEMRKRWPSRKATRHGEPVIEGVLRSDITGAAHAAVSNNGSLIYLPGSVSGGVGEQSIALISRDAFQNH